MKALSERERRFVDAYMGDAQGNATKAATLAGYARGSAHVTGCRLLRKANVATAVQNATGQLQKASIASAEERRELLTTMARDPNEHPVARLKGVDILNKMDGLYVNKHEHSGTVTLEQVLDSSRDE